MNRKTKLGMILLGGTLTFTTVLAGCGSVNQTSLSGNGPSGKNNPDGLFRELGGWPLPAQFQGNPWGGGGIGSAWTFVTDGLFQIIRTSNKIYMHLASSYDNSVPGQTTVRIRKDARWNDGQPFTSKDVWAYYMLNNGAELTHYLKSVETPDDHTVVFRWANPAPYDELKMFLIAVDNQGAMPYHYYKQWVDKAASLLQQAPLDTDPMDKGKTPFGKKISPELQKQLDANWQDFSKHGPKFPLGAGPYKVTKVTATDMILEKNPYFYGASKVKFKKIDLKMVSDLNQQYALLRAGQLDRYDGTQPKDILESILGANKNLVHYQMLDAACVGLIFNTAHSPFENETFRRAIVYALDRNKIREVGNYYGKAPELAATGFPTSDVPTYIDPDVLQKFTKYPHDDNKAAELLASIGWSKGPDGLWKEKNGKTPHFTIASAADWVPAVHSGEIVAEQLTAFGIPTKYKAVDPGIYWGNVDKGKGTYDMSFDWIDVAWGFDKPWNTMRNTYWWNTFKHAHIPQNKTDGGADFVHSGFDGQSISPDELLHQIPFMTSESDRRKALEEIAYVTNESAFEVNLFQNVTGTWFNMKTIGGVPWASAIAKYNRDMPIPPANQNERIIETNEGYAGYQWMIDGSYYPN